jgi:glycosyltransferase involved in cell wall biosynthesis
LRLREVCEKNHRIKAILFVKNFGGRGAGFYHFRQASGDCVICMASDFQDPPKLIPTFVREWENGYKIVAAVKKSTHENLLMRFWRACYYKIMKKMSIANTKPLENFTGFGLYDKSFVDMLTYSDDRLPNIRALVTELGFKRKDICIEKTKRRTGRSSYNWFSYYNEAMYGITTYSNYGLRLATILGFITSGLSILASVAYFVYKLLHWDAFSPGIAPLVIGVFFLGGLQMSFIGLICEYVMTINTRMRLKDYPPVIEEERINF